MNVSVKKFLPHLIVLVLFVIASLAYFSPVLQGKAIFQSDIVQYTGMAKQQNDFRKTTGEETYWTDSAFGGMPTYQLGAKYPHNYIKKLDLALRFLPRPADYLFLYFIGMYILLLVLKVDYKLAFLGALAFGFSTYLIIILGVGHNAKAHAIAYMPLVLSGIILTFKGKYLWGFLLTTVAMGLELVTNHFQMTYYLLLLVICIGIAYLVDAVKKKMLPHYFKAVGVMAIGVLIAVGLNATNILATKEYADTSTRGKSELTINPDGTQKDAVEGLDYEYITEYSYGKLESFNLLIPRFMGGGNQESIPKNGALSDELLKMGVSQNEINEVKLPLYWGDQPIVAAPAYIGAIMFFLAVLALFLIRGRLKWWAVAGLLTSLFLSWGDNFETLTRFFIDFVPLYNKFRAVSSIQVLIELIVPILAIVGLNQFFNEFIKIEERKKALIFSTGIVGGVILLFLLFKSSIPFIDFASELDNVFRKDYGNSFVNALREDRADVFFTDSIRSLILILLSASLLWLFMKNKLNKSVVIGVLVLLVLFDLIGVDKRYVNNDEDKWATQRQIEQPYQMSGADEMILKDDGHYRVYDATNNAFNSGAASYYHNALGGYHAAKPGRMKDIADFYLYNGDVGIMNMLNVKYFIVQNKGGGPVAQRNPYANGPAWFVENVQFAGNSNEEIQLLDSLDTKKTVIVHQEFKDILPLENIQRDSTATIELVQHQPNHLTYEASTKSPQLAVFSEVYYPEGWNAYINGKPAEYIRVNYLLRGMKIPVGNNKVEFKFEAAVVKTGSSIALGSSILLLLAFLGGLYFTFRSKKEPQS